MAPPPLSFRRAEYGGDAIPVFQCAWCSRGLTSTCFRANGATLLCHSCALRAVSAMPENSRRVFLRSLAWGAVACVAAALAILLVGRLTLRFGWLWTELVFLGGGAGYVIGRAMRHAARGAGGRRYQIVASLLVYAAIAIPASALILGTDGVPMWALPLLVFAPPVWVFIGRGTEAGLILFPVVLGIRFAWAWLKPWPLRITGPEPIPGTIAASEAAALPEAELPEAELPEA